MSQHNCHIEDFVTVFLSPKYEHPLCSKNCTFFCYILNTKYSKCHTHHFQQTKPQNVHSLWNWFISKQWLIKLYKYAHKNYTIRNGTIISQ